MTKPDPETEYSPLCSDVERDGFKVSVQIYRLKDAFDAWVLEVIDRGESTVWNDMFVSDEDAYVKFYETLEADGIWAFLCDAPEASA
jgi:hypothetical protein